MSTKSDILVYRVYDTEEQKYWEAYKQKVWLKPASAKNAWNVGYCRDYKTKVPFNKQTRFVIHSFKLQHYREIT